LARFQGDPCEAFQTAHRLLDACTQVAHIALRNIRCSAASDVLYIGCCGNERSTIFASGLRPWHCGSGHRNVCVGELRIAETVSERKKRVIGNVDIA
jgi:hypothetical protein